MKPASTILLAAAALALAMGTAAGADQQDRAKSDDPGFNNLDRNNDGSLSRTEAAGNPYLVAHFKDADKNGDGKLSRTEYLRVMTAKDLSTLKEKFAGKKEKEPSAGAGATKSK